MALTYRVDRDRALVLVTLQGAMTLEQYRTFLAEFAAAGAGPWGMLVDTTALGENLPVAQVREVAELLRAEAPRLGITHLAIVAPGDVTFGQSRMFEAFSSEGPVRMHVARSAEQAAAWVTARRS